MTVKIDFAETNLLRKRNRNLVTICLNIVEITTEHLTGLIAYQVLGDELMC